MVLAHDTEVALEFVVRLVNSATTGPDGADTLWTVGDLEALLGDDGWTGSRTHDQAEVEAMRRLRPGLLGLWIAGEDEAVDLVNDLLRKSKALPQLVRHDRWDWHLHATPADAPLATRVAVETAMAFVDVIRAGELDRLRVCDADECNDLVLDLSRNRSRRYCEGGCGARAHSAAYRARKAEAPRAE
ncbi:MAG: CGNR zinc finger domain-containing protein [Intrasporangium sp.]|uniref:CGNR zinc finger domain-containing protein n=1 Tax=Intrasporangium sp. TaxID=1925024 RepID=UPI00264A475B|nr:CGNR zinc finger domain-containing protein [Intrasporangium sp.]MDN5797553.1 CGNR zinc finger domain-containing protein [Intrasporangium sp.]